MSSSTGSPRHVVVVGGGIAGLSAALFVKEGGGAGVRVTVLESAPAVGGKLAPVDVAGLRLDAGAEALLARRPEAVELVRKVGLGADLVDPRTTAAGVWTRGLIRPMPRAHVFGVPTDLRALGRSGVLSPVGLARAAVERLLPRRALVGDVSVGRFVRERWGTEVLERLVDPLLGGVYAGRADGLSLAATAPPLAAAARAGERAVAASTGGGAVFAGVCGGVWRLSEAVARAGEAEIRTGVTVRQLHRLAQGWRLVTGPASAPVTFEADAVVIAVPAAPAARLLSGCASGAAAELREIEYASVAVVTLVLPANCITRPLRGSGFLVPPVEGRLIKAVTWSSAKWGWTREAAGGAIVLRASVGRFGDFGELARTDEELVATVWAELSDAVGLRGEPMDSSVTRWGGALPQYAVGHLERVARIRAAVAALPALAVCGAAYDGVGIAACIASAQRAASTVVAACRVGAEWGSSSGEDT